MFLKSLKKFHVVVAYSRKISFGERNHTSRTLYFLDTIVQVLPEENKTKIQNMLEKHNKKSKHGAERAGIGRRSWYLSELGFFLYKKKKEFLVQISLLGPICGTFATRWLKMRTATKLYTFHLIQAY